MKTYSQPNLFSQTEQQSSSDRRIKQIVNQLILLRASVILSAISAAYLFLCFAVTFWIAAPLTRDAFINSIIFLFVSTLPAGIYFYVKVWPGRMNWHICCESWLSLSITFIWRALQAVVRAAMVIVWSPFMAFKFLFDNIFTIIDCRVEIKKAKLILKRGNKKVDFQSTLDTIYCNF